MKKTTEQTLRNLVREEIQKIKLDERRRRKMKKHHLKFIIGLMNKYKNSKDGLNDFSKFAKELESEYPAWMLHIIPKGVAWLFDYAIDNLHHPTTKKNFWDVTPDQIIYKGGPKNLWILRHWE